MEVVTEFFKNIDVYRIMEFLEFLAGIGIFGYLLKLLIDFLVREYKKSDNALKSLGDYFTHRLPTKGENNKDILGSKASLYSGVELPYFDSNISIERDLVPEILKIIADENKDFLHVHIFCKLPKQGISTFLDNLIEILSKNKSNIVLQARDFAGEHNKYNMAHFKDLPSFFRPWKQTHLILLLDDTFTGNQKVIASQNKIINSLRNLNNERLKITVISGNHNDQEIPGSIRRKLEFTIPEERLIFRRIFEEPPVLVHNFETNIETFWGWARNGKNEYGSDLYLFLTLLHEFADNNKYPIEETWGKHFRAPLELTEEERLSKDRQEVITVVAAYSVLNIPLSDISLARICRNQIDIDWFRNLRWIDSGQDNLESTKLRPGLARSLLRSYSIDTANKLRNKYKLSFNWESPFRDWDSKDQELLRHLFRRLNDDRHNNIKVGRVILDGTEISLPLYEEKKHSISEYLETCNDLGTLSSWAITLSRKYISDLPMMKVLLYRTIEVGKAGNIKIETSEAFVSFGSALIHFVRSYNMNQENKIELVNCGLCIMNYDAAFKNAENYNVRRTNQVITTNFRLKKLISIEAAYEFIKGYEDSLDSRGFEELGRAIDRKEDSRKRLFYFREARRKALEQIRDFPLDYVRQTIAYMKENKATKHKYFYNEIVEDTIRLIHIIGDQRSARFNENDIEDLKSVIEEIKEFPNIRENESLMIKLTTFNAPY